MCGKPVNAIATAQNGITFQPWEPPGERLRRAFLHWLEVSPMPEGFPYCHDVEEEYPDSQIVKDYRIIARKIDDPGRARAKCNTNNIHPVYLVSFYADNKNLAQLVGELWSTKQMPYASMQWQFFKGLTYDSATNLYYVQWRCQLVRYFGECETYCACPST